MESGSRFIYNLLVESEQDVVGHIAYSLYKADKIAFIEKYKSENVFLNGTTKVQQGFLKWYNKKRLKLLDCQCVMC